MCRATAKDMASLEAEGKNVNHPRDYDPEVTETAATTSPVESTPKTSANSSDEKTKP